jgi:predicted MFS family arabinose efflux permease
LTRFASRFDTKLVIAVSVSAMALSVSAFFIVGSNMLLYGMASAFVGFGYGLALPSVQAQAVNVSEPAVRPRVLPLAGLVFQAAMLGFPLIAGWIIANLGYQALFVVLVTFAFIQAALGWWRFSAARRSAGAGSVAAAGPSTMVPSGTAARNGVLREC